MKLKKNGKAFTSKFFGTGPSSYEKRIYRAVVSQRLRNIGIDTYQRYEQNCYKVYSGDGDNMIL
jgi:hypothetical protein